MNILEAAGAAEGADLDEAAAAPRRRAAATAAEAAQRAAEDADEAAAVAAVFKGDVDEGEWGSDSEGAAAIEDEEAAILEEFCS